jgi:hypothetical protein
MIETPEQQELVQIIFAKDANRFRALPVNIDVNSAPFRKFLHYVLIRELDGGDIAGGMHEIVKGLVKNFGYQINTSTVMEKPVLFFYLYYKEFELAEELIALGADVNVLVGTGNQTKKGYKMEPLICEFIQRMNPKRDFPEDFSSQIAWLKERGADEKLAFEIEPYNKRVKP